jgi:hypothetical protein
MTSQPRLVMVCSDLGTVGAGLLEAGKLVRSRQMVECGVGGIRLGRETPLHRESPRDLLCGVGWVERVLGGDSTT